MYPTAFDVNDVMCQQWMLIIGEHPLLNLGLCLPPTAETLR